MKKLAFADGMPEGHGAIHSERSTPDAPENHGRSFEHLGRTRGGFGSCLRTSMRSGGLGLPESQDCDEPYHSDEQARGPGERRTRLTGRQNPNRQRERRQVGRGGLVEVAGDAEA